jgi:hypothetical protein
VSGLICLCLKAVIVHEPGLYRRVASSCDIGEMLLRGLMRQSSPEAKAMFQELIYFLAANVRPSGAAVCDTPLADLLGKMLDTKVFTNEQGCEELYDVLVLLIDLYKACGAIKGHHIPASEKLQELLALIHRGESKELSSTGPPDHVLCGQLQLACKLFNITEYNALEGKARIEMVEDIFFGCLFPLRKSPTGKHEFKCKTTKAREVAYNLLNALTGYNNEAILFLMKECMEPLGQELSELTVWAYSPEAVEKSPLGFVGIKNLGCICYIISMVQQFFLVGPFRNAILAVDDKKPPALSETGIDDNLLHQLRDVFGHLQLSGRRDFVPNKFCYSLKELDGRPINMMVQHDAHEFLNILFERLELGLKDTPYNRLLQSIFGGQLCSQLQCKSCGNISPSYEDYYTLSLEIKNQKTLADAFDRYVAPNEVSDYMCAACKKKVDVTKRTLISTLPNVLIVHLQRFNYNFDTLMNDKVLFAFRPVDPHPPRVPQRPRYDSLHRRRHRG